MQNISIRKMLFDKPVGEIFEEILEERIESESRILAQLVEEKRYSEAAEYLETKEKEQE